MSDKALEGKIVAVDFDGVVHKYTTYKGKGVFEEPCDGVAWAMRMIKQEGGMVVINTCRRETQDISDYLKKHGIPYDTINHSPRNKEFDLGDKKVAADFYIDDKGISFRGDWKETYLQMLNFKRWGLAL